MKGHLGMYIQSLLYHAKRSRRFSFTIAAYALANSPSKSRITLFATLTCNDETLIVGDRPQLVSLTFFIARKICRLQ